MEKRTKYDFFKRYQASLIFINLGWCFKNLARARENKNSQNCRKDHKFIKPL